MRKEYNVSFWAATMVLIFPISILAATPTSIDLEKDLGQYLVVPNDVGYGLGGSNDLTLETWINLESQPSNVAWALLSKWEAENDQRSYALIYQDDNGTKQLIASISTDGQTGVNRKNHIENLSLDNGIWNHVAWSYDQESGVSKLYVNGIQIGINADLGTQRADTAADFKVGYEQGSPTFESFDGKVEEIRVWNVVRTALEIAGKKDTELTGAEPGLMGYWNFNGNTDDLTVNGNNLSNINSASFSDSPINEGQCIPKKEKKSNKIKDKPIKCIKESAVGYDDLLL